MKLITHPTLMQRSLTRLVGWLAKRRMGWLTQIWIKWFVQHYKVNLDDMAKPLKDYATFNDFFTRPLKASARPLPADPAAIVSPVDGVISACGMIHQQSLLQAKGHHYSLSDLIAGDDWLQFFGEDSYALTAYLSPRDYHRIHMPMTATLQRVTYVPGKLFPVNPKAVATVDGLFARNERALCFFETAQGPMIMVLVGAMIVAGLVVKPLGHLNAERDQVCEWRLPAPQHFQRGDELGYFEMGSTVILLLPPHVMQPNEDLVAGQSLKMGATLGIESYE